MVLVPFYRRAISSYEASIASYHVRVQDGLQPSTWLLDLFDMDVEETLLVVGNVLYVLCAGALYVKMRRRGSAYNVKVPMLLYNLLHVAMSLYIAVGLVRYKLQEIKERHSLQEAGFLRRGGGGGGGGGGGMGGYSGDSGSGFCVGAGGGGAVSGGEQDDACFLMSEERVQFLQHAEEVLNADSTNFMCNTLRTDPLGQAVARLIALFYIQKWLEFGDTFFFLLRFSFRQVTFLHLFHHSSITVVVGSFLPFDFNGDIFLPILTNCIAHALMYSHYILTSMGIHAWWSPYLTSCQLVQFGLIFTQSLMAYLRGPSCGSPDFVKVLLLIYMCSMLVLFSVFFTQRYILKIDAADMCGVIKSQDPAGTGVARAWHGNCVLDEDGKATVTLPKGFHHSASGLSLMFCYQLSPIREPMPDLHIGQEVGRTLKGLHQFQVAGGVSWGKVSWTLASVQIEDRVPN